MPQMTVPRPLRKLDLGNQLGTKPSAILHFFFCQCPLRAFFFWKIGKRTLSGLQAFELLVNLAPKIRDKSIPHLCRKVKLLALVIANDQRVEWISWRVSTDHEFLPAIYLVLDPCAGSFAGLVKGITSFGHNTFKTKLLHDAYQVRWARLNV